MSADAHLASYYVSRDRVLSLIDPRTLPADVLAALSGADVRMASAILSNMVGDCVLPEIAKGNVKTLQQLSYESDLRPGALFIYNGTLTGKGFGVTSKGPSLTLTAKLDEPLPEKLIIQFAKDGLVNDTAATRLSGQQRGLFVLGYVRDVDAQAIHALPYLVGDLVSRRYALPVHFSPGLEVRPEQIKQFGGIDLSWYPGRDEFLKLAYVPEHAVKSMICSLVAERDIPNDWGGEESDLFTANLDIDGKRQTGAFLLKGPAAFHPMTLKDCGKNGDQIYRLFNIPADLYVVQHCHNIGPAVRKTVEAFALQRSLAAPCKFAFLDGVSTARLLKLHGQWPAELPEGARVAPPRKRRR